MKRRKLLLLSSGALITLPSCGSKKSKDTAQKSTNPTSKVVPPDGTERAYRHPAYAGRGLKNPSINLPSSFWGRTVTHRSGPSSQPYVAMTFDDGPHPQNTPRLLNILRDRNIKATFYVIGNCVDRHPHIVRRIVAEGHEIGNHTYTHRKLTTLRSSEVRTEMSKTQAAIVRALRAQRRIMTLWVFVHPSCDMTLVSNFSRIVQRAGWSMSTIDAYFPDMGDTIADNGTFLLGVHKGASMDSSPIRISFPPSREPRPMASFLYHLCFL